MKTEKKTGYITFQQAIEQTPDVAVGFKFGLEALGNHRTKILLTNEQFLNGSIDIDTCTKKKYPDANRWDYALSYNELVYFVEIHPAKTSEVSIVLKKQKWLKDWLNNNAPLINQLKKAQPAYYWISTKNIKILKTSPQYRQLTLANLQPKNQLALS
jgi:hypothetical protein